MSFLVASALGELEVGVPSPIVGEVYRLHSPLNIDQGHYIYHYVIWKGWLSDIKNREDVIVCPTVITHGNNVEVTSDVIQEPAERISFRARLSEITDDLERRVALALIHLSDQHSPVHSRAGLVKRSADNLPQHPAAQMKPSQGGGENWQWMVCCEWASWERAKEKWGVRAALVREHFPHTKMSAHRLTEACRRMGLTNKRK